MAEELTAKEVSVEQERRIAKIFGGRVTARSGGGPWQKTDILGVDWACECKTTVKPSLSYSVNKAVVDKLDHERAEMHKPYAALAFTLGENRDDYFVISSKTMKAIVEQQSAIKELLTTVKASLQEVEKRKAQMTTGIATLSTVDAASYNAHKAEKQKFIEELERIV